MSYDVSIADKSFNYTSNTSRLFREHVGGSDAETAGIQMLDGLTGAEAAAVLANAFERLDSTRHSTWDQTVPGDVAFRTKYDSDNGWGTTLGAILFLGKILGACAVHPDDVVSVS